MKFSLCIISLSLAIIIQIATAEEAELKIEVVEKPEKCSRKTKTGDALAMHYTGRLKDGKKFDSSLDRGKTFDFTLGKGMVIQGWEQGLLDMCVGEKRKLTIPPHLGKLFKKGYIHWYYEYRYNCSFIHLIITKQTG